MATKTTTTGSSTIKSGVSSSVEDPKTYDDVFTSKYTFTEANGAGANAFKIHSDTVTVALSLKGTSGDVIIIDGYSGDYTAKLAGSKLTLDNNNQIITVALAAKSIVKLKFLDGIKEVNLTEKTLGGDSLITKSGVLHINGMNSHELTSVTTAVKAALTDVNKKNYATVDAAIISDNAVVKSTALTDKSGKSYATVDAAITSNDAAITTQALTDTSVTPNVSYPNLNAAIISNDNTIISQALTGTNFSTIASLISAYNKFALQSLTSFNIEALTPATMLPASAVSVSEGATAYFKISLTNRGTGDYSVKTMLTGTIATPDNDFVNSLTLDNASIAAGIRFNPTTGILTIPASSQSISAILSTTIKNDMVSPETGEKVNLAISDAQGASVASLGTTDIASVTILDVPPATFSVTPNTGPVLEGASTTFTVKLDNHALSAYSVKVALTGNNAVLNSDFSALTLDPTTPATIKFDSTTGILTIPADSKTTSVKFNTNILTDIIAEKTQSSVTLALSQDTTNSSNANTLITSTASSTTAVITDTTPSFSVTAGSSTVDKGKPASFTVSLTNASTGDYKVNLAATTLNSSILNTLALDSTNSNAGVTFDGSILTVPAATITAANKLPIKVVLTSLTNPIDNTSISLVLSNPTGTNVATAPVVSTPITINNVSATLLTSDIDSIITPDNSNTLILATSLTVNATATLFDSVKDNGINDNDVMNIITNSWPISPAKTILIDKIETINLTALATITVDMSAITGVNNFNIKNSTANVTLDKITSASTILGLEGSLVNNLTAKYKTAPKITDTLTVILNNATNAIFTVDSGFGFAELNVMNASTLTTFDGKVSTLTISGVAPLTVGDTTANTGLIGVTNIELINNNVIKFGNIGTNGTATTYITTFKAPTNTGGITTGLIQGATGSFTMQLGSGADSISVQDNTAASTNINDIRLGAGNDTLNFSKSTSGNTYISGEDGNDNIIINGLNSSASSINTVDGGNGDDKITISVSGSYLISGGAGSDIITDGAGSNVIDGGADADTITGGTGNDTITGGAGNDTIYVDIDTDTLTDFTIGNDKLTISSGATAYVYASGVANYSNDVTNSGKLYIDGSQNYAGIPVTIAENITGSSGADNIKGGAGNDTITGGLGSDTITAVAGTDTITDFKIGEDTLTILSGAIAYVYASGTTDFSNVTNSGTGKLYIDGSKNFLGVNVTAAENITGSTGADSIIGGSGNDTITLGSGNDTITAALGNDIVTDFSPISDKLIISNGASATVFTSGTADFSTSVTNSGTGILNIDGSQNYLGAMVTNAEIITGSTGADVIYGGSGNDTITGGLGNDTIDGKEGSDNIIVNSGIDTINNYLPSTDTLIISSGAIAHVYTSGSNSYVNVVTNNGTLYIDGIDAGGTQSITGSNGADSIIGGGYNDTITGGNGNDTISGGYGDDSITGGLGDDIISGGSGRNTITVDNGTDTITDFLLSYDTLIVNSASAIAHLYAFTSATGGTVNYSNISNLGTLYIDGSTTYAGTQITGIESITGSNGADSIVGGSGNDTIIGFGGNDTITGGAGNDDIYVGSSSINTITDFVPSSDTLTIVIDSTAHVYASGTMSYMTAVKHSGYTTSGTLYIDGSRSYTDPAAITTAESITGSPISDSIVGGSGNDTITGGTGIDTLTGGAGADTFVFGTNGSLIPQPQANPLLISNQDSISDFTSGTDLIRFAGTVVFNKVTIPNAGPGVSVDDYGFATFNPDVSYNLNTSYSAKVSALQASTTTKTPQTVTLFVDGTDTYVFFAGATVDTGDDQVIKLTGVSGRFFDAITINANGTDITIS